MTDDFSRHEILHMASFLAGVVDSELLESEAIKENVEWVQLARKAHTALYKLYQEIGKAHFK